MQRFYDIVQPRSNIPLSNGDLHYNYGLETKLALVMNTKVVHNDILNMFKLIHKVTQAFHTLVTFIRLNYEVLVYTI